MSEAAIPAAGDAASKAHVVSARGLARHYAVGGGLLRQSAVLRAVDGVDFDLEPARTLAVVGESGSGKSTLARLVTRIEAPTAGDMTIGGVDALHPTREQAAQMRRDVQMVFQNPFGSLNPRRKIGTTLEEVLVINTDWPQAKRRARALDIMAKVGLRPEHYDRFPHMFSGGQRQRIAIARALMLEPKVVVADEPVSALDVSVQAQVLNLLKDLQDEFGLAYLFISHDLSVVRHLCQRVAVMYLGNMVELAETDELFDNPMHPYTQALLEAVPIPDPTIEKARAHKIITGEIPSPINPPPGCVFHPRCTIAVEECKKLVPEFREVKPGHWVACSQV